MINLTRAYAGALAGYHNNDRTHDARATQHAICYHLAMMKPRGKATDGAYVSDADVATLRPVAGKRGMR